MDGGLSLKSYRCLGETRNGRQCAQRCVAASANELFSFCAEHESQRSIRLTDFRAQGLKETDVYEWRQLNLNNVNAEHYEEDTNVDRHNTTTEPQIEPQRRRVKDRDLRELADDDENIHTIEIQRPLLRAITALRTWADKNQVKVESDLALSVKTFLTRQASSSSSLLSLKSKTEQVIHKEANALQTPKRFTDTVVNEFWRGSMKTLVAAVPPPLPPTMKTANKEFVPTKVQKDCIDHLMRVYSVDDKESVLGITFPVLSSWVWQRVIKTDNEERRNELVKRFVEEMAESKGLCLQGNLTRLINVFSGLDAEVSLQDVDLFDTGPISESYMQQQVAAAVTRFTKKALSYEELLKTVHVLMKRANASKEVLDDWLGAIEDLVTVRTDEV